MILAGINLSNISGVSSALACQGLCAAENGCVAFSFGTIFGVEGTCQLLSSNGGLIARPGVTSGPVSC